MAKTHNWTTSGKTVNSEAHRLTLDFLNGCNHLTPAAEAELDNLLAELERNHPDEGPGVICEPDAEIVEMMEKGPDPDWWETAEPPAEAYEYESRATR